MRNQWSSRGSQAQFEGRMADCAARSKSAQEVWVECMPQLETIEKTQWPSRCVRLLVYTCASGEVVKDLSFCSLSISSQFFFIIRCGSGNIIWHFMTDDRATAETHTRAREERHMCAFQLWRNKFFRFFFESLCFFCLNFEYNNEMT